VFPTIAVSGGAEEEKKRAERKRGHNSCLLAKDGFNLKAVAIIFHSSPCGFLYHFDLSRRQKKKSKNGIKLLHAKVSDLGKKRPNQHVLQKVIFG
jgi:hypothetical protein